MQVTAHIRLAITAGIGGYGLFLLKVAYKSQPVHDDSARLQSLGITSRDLGELGGKFWYAYIGTRNALQKFMRDLEEDDAQKVLIRKIA